MQQQSRCRRRERTRTSHHCCTSIQQDQTQKGACLTGGCRGISHPDVPCQLCSADVQHRPPCLCQKHLLNGEQGGKQGEASAQGLQAGEAALPGRAQAKPRLASDDADAQGRAAPQCARHSLVPLEATTFGSRCLMKWAVKGLLSLLALSPPQNPPEAQRSGRRLHPALEGSEQPLG